LNCDQLVFIEIVEVVDEVVGVYCALLSYPTDLPLYHLGPVSILFTRASYHRFSLGSTIYAKSEYGISCMTPLVSLCITHRDIVVAATCLITYNVIAGNHEI
jgi:hypothetical protein